MHSLRLLVVEDDPEMLVRVARSLRDRLGERAEIVEEQDFDRALPRLAQERFDMVILDVRKGDPSLPLGGEGPEAGRLCYDAIRARRFLPVIFHTGLPRAVLHLQSPVVSVVEKGGAPAVLADAVERVVMGGLPAVVRALLAHVEQVHRDYMWEFGAVAWKDYGSGRPEEFVHLLARRLALSFDGAGIADLLREIRGAAVEDEPSDGLNPVRLYILPPLNPTSHRTGDLYKGTDDLAGFWVLLTPTCDLDRSDGRACKVDEPVLARCVPLTEENEYQAWRVSDSKTTTKALSHLLENNRDKQPERYFFLPGAFDVLPDLVVDLAAVRTVSIARLTEIRHIASLDSPFAASMLTRFLRYFGRFGTADLDVNYVFERLRGQAPVQK